MADLASNLSPNASKHISYFCSLLDPKGGSQKPPLVVLVVVISSLRVPKAFFICSGVQ